MLFRVVSCYLARRRHARFVKIEIGRLSNILKAIHKWPEIIIKNSSQCDLGLYRTLESRSIEFLLSVLVSQLTVANRRFTAQTNPVQPFRRLIELLIYFREFTQ